MNKKQSIYENLAQKKGQIAILVDPEKTQDEKQIKTLTDKAKFANVSYFFIGGSTVTREQFQLTTRLLKKHSAIPLVIFPGSNHQLSGDADALLYLSLLSGRNPEYLIGQHVASAMEVLQLNLEILPTSYILIDGGSKSSVTYVSQTTPIPRDQKTIAINTAIAGNLQGKKITYFDAGSGAKKPLQSEIITSLNKLIDTVTIVGGGIREVAQIKAFKNAGANVIVIGNKIEEDIDFLLDIKELEREKKESY